MWCSATCRRLPRSPAPPSSSARGFTFSCASTIWAAARRWLARRCRVRSKPQIPSSSWPSEARAGTHNHRCSICIELEQLSGVTTNIGGYGSPLSRGRLLVVIERSPLAPCRTGPVLQRRPHTARKPEAVDRRRRSQRLEAMQFDAAPLEAAFLQDVARGGVGDARAGAQVLGIELLEEEVDHRACGLGSKALAPMLDAEPVAEFRRV